MAMRPNDIRAELVRRGVTLAHIARECGVSRPLVTLVVNGKRQNQAVKETVAQHLGMSSQEIFGGGMQLGRPLEAAGLAQPC